MQSTKYFISSIIIIATLLLACNTTKSESIKAGDFLLKVNVIGLTDGTKIALKRQENGSTITIDSTVSKNNEFQFTGNVETPVMFGIFIDSVQGGLFPLVDSGTITITAHKDSLFNPVITGSELNDELKKFKEGSEKIVNQINDLFIQIQKARAENDLETITEINEKMRAINDENTRYSLAYADNNPNSFVSSIILQSVLRIPEIDINEVERIYNGFSEEVKRSEYSKTILRYLQSNVAVQKDSIN